MTGFNWPLMKNSVTWRDKFRMLKFILGTEKYTQGEQVAKFEQEWSEWLGAKYSLFVTSGSTANFLLISAAMEKYNIKPGDKVLLPACTWMTNIAPPIQLGLTPIFCDVNLADYSFDRKAVEKIAKKHKNIKMVFATHLLGITAPTGYLKELFPNAIILDDVCESHGCTDTDGSKIGSNSLGATFSFYFGHHMTTIEGGMISTNDVELYDLMRMKRSHGLARNSLTPDYYGNLHPEIQKSFLFVTDGYNFRNNELSAVLGRSQLQRLDSFIAIRKQNYDRFFQMHAPVQDMFYPLTYQENNSCFCFPLIAKSKRIKDLLIEQLDYYKIEHRPVVGGNLLKQPFLVNNTKINLPICPNADIIHDYGIYVGNNQFVGKAEMDLLEHVLGSLYAN